MLANKPSTSRILAEHGASITFGCAEQVYMFVKALYSSDAESCTQIQGTSDTAGQRKLGKTVKGFPDDEWDHVRSRVARVGNWYKLTKPCNQHMQDILLGMGDKGLTEAGRRDRVWGIGYQEHEAERYRDYWGENRLGRVLMDVRTRIGKCLIRERETGAPERWEWDETLRRDEGDEQDGKEE